jgi:hypothetical protein
MSDYRLKVWVYGPDGKPISYERTDNDSPDKTATKHDYVPDTRIISESDAPCSQNHRRKTHPPSETAKQKWKFWFEVIAVGVAIVGLPILVFQSFSSQRQADAAEKQLSEMHRQSLTDERAWVMVYDYAAIHENGKEVFDAIYKNTGKTPAINVRGCFNVTGSASLIPDVDTLPEKHSKGHILAPEATGHLEGVLASSLFVKGQAVFLSGTMWYDDIFGQHHWSQFSTAIGSNLAGFSALGIHNKSDDSNNGH